MNGTGRPLRFLGFVLCGWLVMRFGLWAVSSVSLPADTDPLARSESLEAFPPANAGTLPAYASEAAPVAAVDGRGWRLSSADLMPAARAQSAAVLASPPPQPLTKTAQAADAADEPFRPAPPPGLAAFFPAAPATIQPSPWSLTGWLLWRPDSGASLGPAPLLGGSQAGLRLDYRLWGRGDRSLAVYGRLTRALERPFAEEAALGVALRPVVGLPVALLAERRVRLGEGGRSDFAFLAAGGVGPVDIGPQLELEGYGQAGIVGLDAPDGFADGRLALAYRLAETKSGADVALGIAAWASAQPGASRVDLGPELRVRLPAGAGRLRLSAEWRQRVAGSARPASGPAVTLVADF